ncbi:MAG TPA: DUF6529 family protein [Acidimicrobiales bacterium]
MAGRSTAGAPTAPVPAGLLAGFGLGAAIAVCFGIYARAHDPSGETVAVLWFSGQIQMKVWFATVAAALAVVQVVTALWIYGKIGSGAPGWAGDLHRLLGTLAFLFSLPVAYHCLWSLGYKADPTFGRVLFHAVFGCLLYGAFVAKVLVVRTSGLPGWALPLAGGVLFSALVVVWFTSAFWFFTTFDGPKL